MKTLVKKLTHLLTTALVLVLISSCAQEEQPAVQPIPENDPNLTALVDLFYADYSEANVQKFLGSYEKLSLEELLAFRELQLNHQQAKGGRLSAEMVAQDAEKYSNLYEQALSETGVALNRMNPEQLDAFFTKLEKSEAAAANARTEQATCPVVSANDVAEVVISRTGGIPWSVSRLVDLGGKNDCDCEIIFSFPQGNDGTGFNYGLYPIQVGDALLGRLFNNKIGVRIALYSVGAFFGRDRMWYAYGHVDCRYIGFLAGSI